MIAWPLPDPADATAEAAPESVDLGPGEQATVEFTPERSGSVFRIPTVAISKRTESTYSIRMDGSTEWDTAAVPPTDIDDLQPVWLPAKRFESKLEVQVANIADSGGIRTYHIMPVGWEVTG